MEHQIHPEMLAMLAEFDAVPAGDTIEEKRENWRKFCSETRRPRPENMTVEDSSFAGPVGDVDIRIYRPAGVGSPAPCVLYIHGGGFMTGDLDTNDTIAWSLAEGSGCVVVSTHYRLAPDNPYPAAFDDSYAALCHIAENSDALGLDANRIGVCGDSAGGNLAAAVCLAARDRKGPSVAVQAIIYPGFRSEGTLPSFTTYAH
ncbi:MAG: alpha/beta hydrolase, partial [Alphaproteobacteria bacterium]